MANFVSSTLSSAFNILGILSNKYHAILLLDRFCAGGWPCPGTVQDSACQETSRFLICPGKIPRMNQSENKASFIQVEKKEEARVQEALWQKQKVCVWVDMGHLTSELCVWSVLANLWVQGGGGRVVFWLVSPLSWVSLALCFVLLSFSLTKMI